MKDLKGKSAVVTGAASGIGRATAIELAGAGVNLVIVDICGEELAEVAREAGLLGVEVDAFCLDLADWDAVKGMAETIVSRCGPVDILVNCAGILLMSHLIDTTLDDWRCLLDVNLWSMIHTVKAFAPGMVSQKSGHIVNISSGQAYFAVPMSGAYASTKFAVDGFSEALRYEMFWRGWGSQRYFQGSSGRTCTMACVEACWCASR